MYAKLVVGNANISAIGAMRDIGRLITSSSPNIANLYNFSTSSSAIIDPTPAGWTYVGGNRAADQPTISTAVSWPDASSWNLCFSAPTIANSSILKYAVLNPGNYANNTTSNGITLSGAQSANSTGAVTNQSGLYYYNSASATYGGSTYSQRCSLKVDAGVTLHLIASNTHITIIEEAKGMAAIWESSQTDAHTFYGTAPVVAYAQYDAVSSGSAGAATITTPTSAGTSAISIGATGFYYIINYTDPIAGTNYGVYEMTQNSITNGPPWFAQINAIATVIRKNTIGSTGGGKYAVQPVFYLIPGLPTQYITGIVPIYWTAGGIGSSGDTIDVNGDSYTYFNVTSSRFGIIMKTS